MHKKSSSNKRKSRISQAILVGSDYVRRHLQIFLRSADQYALKRQKIDKVIEDKEEKESSDEEG
jgi:hypothetical protein